MVATREFDAVVIGAGPAGSMAALSLARRGVRTLMVDKQARGRWKVCGCCLGSVGRRVLDEAGLASVLADASPVATLELSARGATSTLDLPGFVAIARESLDARLADAAQAAGVRTLWGATAAATPDGTVTIGPDRIRARVVIDASGLRSTARPRARHGRIGLGLTSPARESARCAAGTLTMAVAPHGYLGRVALPDGRVDLAMAARPAFVRAQGSPTAAARAIWARAGLDAREIPDGRWRGTPVLARAASAQDGRVLRVGDAAGYVEPFTGEGMSWALLGASHIAADAIACMEQGPDASAWPRTLHALLAGPHARCRAVSAAVRSPRLVRAAIAVSNHAPRPGSLVAALASGSRRRLA